MSGACDATACAFAKSFACAEISVRADEFAPSAFGVTYASRARLTCSAFAESFVFFNDSVWVFETLFAPVELTRMSTSCTNLSPAERLQA